MSCQRSEAYCIRSRCVYNFPVSFGMPLNWSIHVIKSQSNKIVWGKKAHSHKDTAHKLTRNCFFVRIFVGGKKNRQKERRLLKGFNLALPATAGMNTLPPVSEFGAPFHTGGGCGDSNDYYGTAFAGLMNTTSITPRRNHMYSMQQFSSSQSSFSDTFGTIGRLGKIGSKLRNTSQKRRWGELTSIFLILSPFRHIFTRLPIWMMMMCEHMMWNGHGPSNLCTLIISKWFCFLRYIDWCGQKWHG